MGVTLCNLLTSDSLNFKLVPAYGYQLWNSLPEKIVWVCTKFEPFFGAKYPSGGLEGGRVPSPPKKKQKTKNRLSDSMNATTFPYHVGDRNYV